MLQNPKKIKIKRNKLHHKHTQSSKSKVNEFKSHTHREFQQKIHHLKNLTKTPNTLCIQQQNSKKKEQKPQQTQTTKAPANPIKNPKFQSSNGKKNPKREREREP